MIGKIVHAELNDQRSNQGTNLHTPILESQGPRTRSSYLDRENDSNYSHDRGEEANSISFTHTYRFLNLILLYNLGV